MNKKLKSHLALFIFVFFIEVGFSQTNHVVLVGSDGTFTFSPANLNISAGDTVIWEWRANNHSTTSDAITGPEVWDSGILNNGATFSKVFNETGTYPYHCTPHQSFGMVGTIIVGTALGVNDLNNKNIEFLLNQNSPNPFNPNTNIQFSISRESKVVLTIYDLSGNEVISLINSKLPAGQHSTDWNGANSQGRPLPSGTYIYSLIVNDKTQSLKMILLR